MPSAASPSNLSSAAYAGLMLDVAQTDDIPALASRLQRSYVTFTERLTLDGYTVTLCGHLKGVFVSKTLSVHRCEKGNAEQRAWAYHKAEASAGSIAGLLELRYVDAGEPEPGR